MARDARRAALATERAAFAGRGRGLFAVHPMLYQAVGYVSARSELLVARSCSARCSCSRGWIDGGGRAARSARRSRSSPAAWPRRRPPPRWPFLALAWDRLLRLGSDEQRRRRLLWFHAPLIALVALGGIVRLRVLLSAAKPALPRSFGVEPASQVAIFWRYLGLLLLPVGQSVVHAAADRHRASPSPAVLLSLLALIASGGRGVVVAAARARWSCWAGSG